MVEDKETRRLFLSRAAFLRREMQGCEGRRDYLRDSRLAGTKPRRLIYIFDTNVIVSFCAPWIAGPLESDGRGGFGVIFPPEWSGEDAQDVREQLDRTHATLVLKALAEFALVDASDSRRQWADQRLNEAAAPPRQPILMFPAHYYETGKIYRVVAERARNQGQKTGTEDVLQREMRLATNALALLRSDMVPYDPKGEISGRALSIVDYLVNRQSQWRLKGTIGEWDRYVGLSTKTGGIYSAIDGARFFEDVDGAADAFEVLKRNISDYEQGLRADLIMYWRRQLERQKHGQSVEGQLVDAEALADLFLINHRLELAASNARVVMVTGDENLVRATYGGISLAKVSTEEPRLRDLVIVSGLETARDFSQRYVSHLWGYIGEAFADKDADPEAPNGLADFFNGLLAKGAEPTRFPPAITERIALFPEDFQDLVPSQTRINQTLIDWLVLSKSGAQQSGLIELAVSDELRNAILQIILHDDNKTYTWQQVLALVQEQVDREQDRLTTNLSDTGIGPLLYGGLLGARNPPDLHFSSFPKTQLIFEKLARGQYKDVLQFESDFAAIKDDCLIPIRHGQEDDRQLSYLKYVVLGAAFASADKWSVALEHALMAAAIPERVRPPIPVIPYEDSVHGGLKLIAGREAYFLAAVAQRIIAEGRRDFDKASDYLNRAERAVQLPNNKNANLKSAGHLIRIEGERFARSLSEYYLARSKSPDEHYTDLFNNVAKRCKNILTFLSDPSGIASVGDVARTSFATNVIQTAVIAAYRTEKRVLSNRECPEALQALPECLETIKNLVKLPRVLNEDEVGSSEGRLTCSNLMAAYYFAGALLTEDRENFAFLNKRRSIDDFFPSAGRSIVTSYDTWRYHQLYQFCKSRWA